MKALWLPILAICALGSPKAFGAESFLLDFGNNVPENFVLYHGTNKLSGANIERVAFRPEALYEEFSLYRKGAPENVNEKPFAHFRVSIESYGKRLAFPNFNFSTYTLTKSFREEADEIFSIKIASPNENIGMYKISRVLMRASALLDHENVRKEIEHDGCLKRGTFKVAFKFVEAYVNINKQRLFELVINESSELHQKLQKSMHILNEYAEGCPNLVPQTTDRTEKQAQQNIVEATEIQARYIVRAYEYLSARSNDTWPKRCQRIQTLQTLVNQTSAKKDDVLHTRYAIDKGLIKESDVLDLVQQCQRRGKLGR